MSQATAEQLAQVYLVVGPLYRRAQRLVESAPDADVVPVGVRAVLDMLRRDGPATVPELARRQDLSRQYVQRMVDLALDRGLLERRPNPRHRRSTLLALTPLGAASIGRTVRRELDQLAPVAAGLDHDDVEVTLRVLHTMLEGIPVTEP